MKHTNRRGGHPHRATTLTIGSLVGLAGVLFLPAFTGLPTPGSTAPDKPLNIIFILSDDHRYDFMGFMKPELAPWLQTPNLDRLRREGAHCNNTFVTTALCSPSRASILTGLYSHQHTVVDNQAPEPPSLTYFPEYLQKAGYETAFIGKWHIGSEDDKPRKGFDHWVSFRGQGVYYNPVLNVDGRQVTHGDSAYTTDVLTDYAINWLKKTAGRPSASGNKPRFLYLSHKAVHENFSPNPADRNLYRSQPTRLPASAAVSDLQLEKSPEGQTYADVPKWVKRQRYSWHGVDFAYHGRDKLDDIVHRYAETLHSMDTSIGRLLAYIDASGMAQNTLVIYMSDNGFMLGDHGLIDKRTAYEESMRVPMLMRCPGLIRAGSTINQMIQNVDIAPTLLDLAHVPKPAPMVGRSLLPLLAATAANSPAVQDWRNEIFYEYYWEYNFPQTPTVHALRTDRYKYIRFHGIWDANELYDLQTDPHEMHNLIRVPAQQERIKQMAGQLYDWLDNTGGMQIPLKRTLRPRSGDHENLNTY